MSTQRSKRVNLSDPERVHMLDQLDTHERTGSKHPRRSSARLEYRVQDIPLVAVHPGGGTSAFIGAGRNISCGGISLLVPAFLHTGTETRLALFTGAAQQKVLLGKVTFCRHLSGQVHEIGIRFNEKIDVSAFCDQHAKATSDDPASKAQLEPLQGNALAVSANAADRRVLAALLKSSGLSPTPVDCSGAAIDQIKLLNYAVIVCDLAGLDVAPEKFASCVRASGYRGAIVGIARDGSSDAVDPAHATAFSRVVPKPLDRDSLHKAMRQAVATCSASTTTSGPVHSSLSSDHATGEMVNVFIRQAKLTSVAIQQAVANDDVETLRKTLLGLKSIAGGYGFPSLVEACRQALAAIATPGPIAAADAQIRTVVDICLRLAAPAAGTKAA